jgi:hypothetical protein
LISDGYKGLAIGLLAGLPIPYLIFGGLLKANLGKRGAMVYVAGIAEDFKRNPVFLPGKRIKGVGIGACQAACD